MRFGVALKFFTSHLLIGVVLTGFSFVLPQTTSLSAFSVSRSAFKVTLFGSYVLEEKSEDQSKGHKLAAGHFFVIQSLTGLYAVNRKPLAQRFADNHFKFSRAFYIVWRSLRI